ncbi:MAG: EthD domain-containing protein [Proteobacteria bacterium]|nr:EthD domain-containing protein [Pseudomonadota bacterium]
MKLLFFCSRLPQLTRADYARMLLGDHVPLALKHHPTMRRYTVNIVRDEGGGTSPAPVDSIGQLCFDSLEDYQQRLYDSDEGARLVHEDVARFMSSATAWATGERVVKAAPVGELGAVTTNTKLVVALRRGQGLSAAAFTDALTNDHLPALMTACPGLVACVVNEVDCRLSEDGERWDAFIEFWLAPGVRGLEQELAAAPGRDVLRVDYDSLVADSCQWRVREYVQKR